ncbi:MarR family transcriptional regulator [Peribacillus castrilensis]|uniref:MarR family winged helix-turn-helix transcriptional regulator n=1 Tax=Peribacillus castrilensis TaxID=2897690 RepID=UPI0033785F65
MNTQKNVLNPWVNFSKYHNRISNSLDHILQENYQLGLKEFYLMMFLYESEEKKLRLSQLQKMVDLSLSAVSRLVSRLENHKYKAVKRSTFEGDKRGFYVVLTSEGEKHIVKIIEEVNKTLNEAMSEKDINNLRLFTD